MTMPAWLYPIIIKSIRIIYLNRFTHFGMGCPNCVGPVKNIIVEKSWQKQR
jgi:hypothetical protein